MNIAEPLVITDVRTPGAPGDAWDVLMRDGAVAGLWPAGVERVSGPVRTLEGDGRFVLPGLWDSHVHLDQWAQVSRRLDLSHTHSAADVIGSVSLTVAGRSVDDDTPLLGYGFRDALWPDAPVRATLDAVTGAIPTVLIAADLHCCWINSAAARRWSVVPMESGMVQEEAAFRLQREVTRVPEKILDTWAAEALAGAARRGVVGIVDFEMAPNTSSWGRRDAGGFLAQRVECGVYPRDLELALNSGLRSGQHVAPDRQLVTVGSVKLILDGSLNTRTAYCYDRYGGLADEDSPHGVLTIDPSELVTLVARAHSAGLTSAIHAIGDRANTVALDVFEATGARGSIEHAQLLTPDDVARMAALGIVASVQPEHAMDDRDVADGLWAGRTGRAFPLRSLRDAGVRLTFGSDAPVSPLDPWLGIAAAVFRTRDGRQPWHPEQSLSVAEAIDASTHGSGHRVRVGQPADVILVDSDPLRADMEALRHLPVAATVCAGALIYSSIDEG